MKAPEPVRSSTQCWLCGELGCQRAGVSECKDCGVEWGGKILKGHELSDEQMINHEHKNFYDPTLIRWAISPG